MSPLQASGPAGLVLTAWADEVEVEVGMGIATTGKPTPSAAVRVGIRVATFALSLNTKSFAESMRLALFVVLAIGQSLASPAALKTMMHDKNATMWLWNGCDWTTVPLLAWLLFYWFPRRNSAGQCCAGGGSSSLLHSLQRVFLWTFPVNFFGWELWWSTAWGPAAKDGEACVWSHGERGLARRPEWGFALGRRHVDRGRCILPRQRCLGAGAEAALRDAWTRRQGVS